MASLYSFTLPKPTSSFIIKSSTTTTASPPAVPVSVPVESLQDRFGRKGIKFTETSNGVSLAELTVRNGSSLKLQIPNAHITSYKPKVYWKDDGCEEILYTVPGSGGTGSGAFKSRGGVGLIVNDEKGSSPIATSDWIVDNVDSDAIDALQVELSCKSGGLDINYVVSLYPVSMATAVKVKNNGRKPVKLTSAILTHFISKKRSGAAIQGLQGCSYFTQPPLSSPFELLSPSEAIKTESPGWFFGPEPEKKVGEWTSQDVPFTILGHKLSRVYTAHPEERSKPFHRTTPSKYEYIDQGCELFFRVIRMGFEDIYLSGPGSYSEKFGKDYFICTGPASMVVPVVVNPGEEWRGAQVIEHDNL